VIEPGFSLKRVTDFDVYPNIVQLESSDFERPNYTRVGYGLTNRLYAKKDTSREVLAVSISQSYYTDELAAQSDGSYQTGYNTRPFSKYSPVALEADFRSEWDHTSGTFLSLGANGSVNSANVQASGGWAQAKNVPRNITQPVTTISHYLNASVTLRTTANKVGGTYSFNYDMLADRFLQQRYFAYYNAQCCGVLVEYQTYNIIGLAIPQDRRFNVSFSLAGIGTFSNFLGAFGGQTGR
jgi:hypothetical protein